MHSQGHVGLNLLLYAPIAFWLVSQNQMLLMGYAMVGVIALAAFPDIDLTIGIRHRGPTHSVWFAMLMGTIYAGILIYSGTKTLTTFQLAAVGFGSGFVGVIGHIIGDLITPMGVRPFDPISSREFKFVLTTAGNKKANRTLMSIGAMAFVLAIILGTVEIQSIIDAFTNIAEQA